MGRGSTAGHGFCGSARLARVPAWRASADSDAGGGGDHLGRPSRLFRVLASLCSAASMASCHGLGRWAQLSPFFFFLEKAGAPSEPVAQLAGVHALSVSVPIHAHASSGPRGLHRTACGPCIDRLRLWDSSFADGRLGRRSCPHSNPPLGGPRAFRGCALLALAMSPGFRPLRCPPRTGGMFRCPPRVLPAWDAESRESR